MRILNFGLSGTTLTIFNSFGDSKEFACAAAVSQSVLRDISNLISVCSSKRPEREV